MRGRFGVEQPGLGIQVVRHRGMEVEVVARQVREPADREVHRIDPSQRQRVTGHLHHHRVYPAFGHHRQQRLQIGRLRGGQRARLVAAVDPDPDRPDQARHPSRRTQAGLDQVGGGGLAGRTGDADDAQPLRRMAVDRGGHLAEHRARRRVHQHRHVDVGTEHVDARRVGQHGDRARATASAAYAAPCADAAGQRGEQVTGAGVLAAQRHPGDRGRRTRPNPVLGPHARALPALRGRHLAGVAGTRLSWR